MQPYPLKSNVNVLVKPRKNSFDKRKTTNIEIVQ